MSHLRGNIRQLGMIMALVFVAIFFQVLTGGMLFRPGNIFNLVIQNSYILILAIGMMLVIITGRIDLSVGTLVPLTGAISGILMVNMGWPLWATIPVVLLVGAISGAWNGFWIAYKNIPFFVVTLAGMMVYRGLNMVILGDGTITNFPPLFHEMAAGAMPNALGRIAGLNVTAILICILASLVFVFFEFRKRTVSISYEADVLPMPFFIAKLVLVAGAINLFGFWFASSRGFPNILILLSVLIIGYSFIASRTVMGRHIYATGGNPRSAELSGVKTKQVVFWVYVNMGVLAALAGLVFAARANAASPRAEAGFELQAIAAAFIGGASPSGGVGKITGAITGAMFMGILSNGLSMMGVGADIRLAITGLVLLAAVAFDVYTKKTQVTLEAGE